MTPLLDRGWLGVKMGVEPALIPAGYAAEAVNMRFNRGVPETRPGVAWPAWANKITADGIQPWGTIHGVGEYKDPISLRVYQVIAADGAVWYTQPFNAPVQMTLPAGVTISGQVTFTQAYDQLVLWRGFELDPLIIDGIRRPWSEVPDPAPGTGLRRIPRAERALYFQNRLWIPTAEDEVMVSDFNDITGYLPGRQELTIAPGSGDRLLTLVKSGRNTIICFKERSVHALYNVHTSLNSIYLDTLTNTVGLAAVEAVADTGNEIWFLGSDHTVRSLIELGGPNTEGVTRIKFKSATNERGEEVEIDVSEDISPLMERINGQYVGNAQMKVWDRRVYLAIPIDGAELLGPELSYATESPIFVKVTVGKRYRYHPPGALYYDSGDPFFVPEPVPPSTFTAEHDLVRLTVTGLTPTLRQLYSGVNQVMAVYDLRNAAWSGWDEAEGIDWGRLLLVMVNGAPQLMVLTSEGWAGLLEQGYQDVLARPAAEVTYTGSLTETGSLRVNLGSVVTVDKDAETNTVTPPVWGTKLNAARNLQLGFGL